MVPQPRLSFSLEGEVITPGQHQGRERCILPLHIEHSAVWPALAVFLIERVRPEQVAVGSVRMTHSHGGLPVGPILPRLDEAINLVAYVVQVADGRSNAAVHAEEAASVLAGNDLQKESITGWNTSEEERTAATGRASKASISAS
jgi:hypothetical protein